VNLNQKAYCTDQWQVLVSSVNRISGLMKYRKFPGRLTVSCLQEVVADLLVLRSYLTQGQSMWYLWWKKRHWDRIFSEYFSFILSVLFRQCDMCVCNIPVCHRRSIILATDGFFRSIKHFSVGLSLSSLSLSKTGCPLICFNSLALEMDI